MNEDPPDQLGGYRAGTIAHQNETLTEWIITSPHQPLYSTASMVATHFWRDDKWRLIWENEE